MTRSPLDENRAGRRVDLGSGLRAFVPHPLPPEIEYTPHLISLLSEADRALGRVEGVAQMLPDPALLAVPFLRVEAVLSSRIEGTITTVGRLFAAEALPGAGVDESTREVVNYLRAMRSGTEHLRHRPMDLNLVCKLHSELLAGVRSQDRAPGRFREEQVWVGRRGNSIAQASYVPPPPWELEAPLADWAGFAQAETDTPPLIHCGLLHGQFEMIHPFADGNGRVGRLLMSLFLIARGQLSEPLLFLSAFFERHRAEYYAALRNISEAGEWEGWLTFFLEGVATQAKQARSMGLKIIRLREELVGQLHAVNATRNTSALLERLFANPYTNVPIAAQALGVSRPTATRAIQVLVDLGFLEEITGRRRDRQFCAMRLLRLLVSLDDEDAPAPER